MDKYQYQALLADRLQNAVGGRSNDGWVQSYRQALSDYLGLPYGNELEGRSQVVSKDVQEVIEGAMPSFIRTFAGGSRVVEFEPEGEDDIKSADEATELVNYFWSVKNDGFRNTHTWIKDALMNGFAPIKFWYEEKVVSKERKETLDAELITQLGLEPDENGQVIVEPAKIKKQIKIEPIPAPEFRVSVRGGSCLDEVDFIAHVTLKTRSDLLELGVKEADLETLVGEFGAVPTDIVPFADSKSSTISGSNAGDYRLGYSDSDTLGSSLLQEVDDKSLERIVLVDASVLVDKDGDGIAERRRVIWAGSKAEVILYDEEYDHVHFEGLSPILMPHALIGNSVAAQVKDIQFIKTGLLRNALDNLAMQVNPRRQGIVDKFNVDDATNPEIGTIERVKEAGALIDLTTPNVIDSASVLIGAVDGIREARTGFRRFGSMLDGRGQNAYSETAFGAGLVENSNNDRLDLIARTFAETGFRGIYRKILKLIMAHWDEALIVRLMGKPTSIDPTKFNPDMDVVPVVGLGVASKQQKIAEADSMLNIAKEIITLQGGLNGPFIQKEQAYNYLKAAVIARGHKNPDEFIANIHDTENQPTQEPPPDPALVEMQQKMAFEKQKHEDEMQFKYDQMDKEFELKKQEMDMEYALKTSGVGNPNIHSVANMGGSQL